MQGEVRLLAKARVKIIPLDFEELRPVAAHALRRRVFDRERTL